MRDRILAEQYTGFHVEYGQWLTTADVARMLEVTTRGVRWLASTRQLPAEQTRSGQRLFRFADVMRLVQHRATARVRSRRERLAAIRPQVLRGREPQQLALFGKARLRLVPGHETSESALPEAEANALRLLRKISHV